MGSFIKRLSLEAKYVLIAFVPIHISSEAEVLCTFENCCLQHTGRCIMYLCRTVSIKPYYFWV